MLLKYYKNMLNSHLENPISKSFLFTNCQPIGEDYRNCLNKIDNLDIDNKKLFTLYVGDLTENIKETDLLNVFSKYSIVNSLKICYDLLTGRSLGYGYINFESLSDAQHILEKLNFYTDEKIFTQPIRLMWKNENNVLRKSGFGNLFIKNIPVSFNSKSLFEIFSSFGKIISCKVIFSNEVKNINYGFVHFENHQNSRKALKKLNGLIIQNQKICVNFFLTYYERRRIRHEEKKFTNIYIKNIDINVCNEIDIRKIFEKFGKITSIFIPYENKTPRGFVFVNFKDYNDAKNTIKIMNNKKIGNSVIYVGKAEKKKEREQILKKIFLDEELGITRKVSQNNVVIININCNFLEIHLHRFFSQFGKLNNVRILKNKKNCLQKSAILNFENKISIKDLSLKLAPIYIQKKTVIRYSEIYKIFCKKHGLKQYILVNEDRDNNVYISKKISTDPYIKTKKKKKHCVFV